MLTWGTARRVVVFVVGMTVVLFGIALIVLPGPAVVVIPIGLAILATEFVWAQRLLRKMKEKTLAAAGAMGWGNTPKAAPPNQPPTCPPQTHHGDTENTERN